VIPATELLSGRGEASTARRSLFLPSLDETRRDIRRVLGASSRAADRRECRGRRTIRDVTVGKVLKPGGRKSILPACGHLEIAEFELHGIASPIVASTVRCERYQRMCKMRVGASTLSGATFSWVWGRRLAVSGRIMRHLHVRRAQQ